MAISTARAQQVAPPDQAELRRAVDHLLSAAAEHSDPSARARSHAAILAGLHQLVRDVSSARDAAIVELIADQPDASSRRLAPLLGITRQRVDQLRERARPARRPGPRS